jgi:type IV pilus assembly protein PilA
MTTRSPKWLSIAAFVMLLGACAKKPDSAAPVAPASVNLVPSSEQSPHFQAVNSHLDIGGTLYGYADVDGDALEFAGTAQALVRQFTAAQPRLSMFAKQDFKTLFAALGFDDIKAIGVSSVREAPNVYRNRAFLYTPKGRHGLLEAFGGNPAPFVNARMAPADADFYGEYEFNLKAAYDTVESIVAKVNGPEAGTAFREKVRKIGADAHFSLLDLIDGLTGRMTMILRLDPVKNVTTQGPSPLVLPAFSFVCRIDGIGPMVEGAIREKSSSYVASQNGSLNVYTLKADSKLGGIKPVLAIDGNAFYFATTEAFLSECVNRKDGLDKNPTFQSALASVGPVGNGLTWVAPSLLDRMKGLAAMNTQAAPPVHRLLESMAVNLPEATAPMLSVRANLPDGILIRSTWNRSLKADLAMVMVYNPVTVGFLAAMAVPAFEKVRLNAQAVAVQKNLRMLYNASNKYYLDHGAYTMRYDELVGPGKMISSITSVAGETYNRVILRKGNPMGVQLPDGRVFTYPDLSHAPAFIPAPVTTPFFMGPVPSTAAFAPPSLVPPALQDETIVHNLRLLDDAANQYYAEHGVTTTTFEDLVGPGKLIPAIMPVAGENYRSLLFKKGHPLRLYLKDGRTLIYPQQ